MTKAKLPSEPVVFQSSAALSSGCNVNVLFASASVTLFQSSAALSSGCNVSLWLGVTMSSRVSILSRPLERLQRRFQL